MSHIIEFSEEKITLEEIIILRIAKENNHPAIFYVEFTEEGKPYYNGPIRSYAINQERMGADYARRMLRKLTDDVLKSLETSTLIVETEK